MTQLCVITTLKGWEDEEAPARQEKQKIVVIRGQVNEVF